ncbi:MAG: hypothetical protein KJ600_04295 [Nanoarchaeota archaeon]|nr:hypothetical protein [Nanoarchaeota archaeon]MBU1103748.1 hypothetical protein [Nanoarchaeota archaeon]
MILTIRISGQVEIPKEVTETLFRIKLRRKYSAVLLAPTKENLKLLKKIRSYVAYGTIDKETLVQLIKERGQPIKAGDKISAEKIVEGLAKKSLNDLGLKSFFRLHPPRGGIDSKKHFGTSSKAVLGDNKEKINDLVRRML